MDVVLHDGRPPPLNCIPPKFPNVRQVSRPGPNFARCIHILPSKDELM